MCVVHLVNLSLSFSILGELVHHGDFRQLLLDILQILPKLDLVLCDVAGKTDQEPVVYISKCTVHCAAATFSIEGAN